MTPSIMDTKSLYAFMAVYEEKSINKAAKRIFISVQGLSKIVQKLEAELGTPLFVRNNYGVAPTLQGTSLYRQAHSIIDVLENIKYEPSKATLVKYVLSIGSTLGIQAYLTRQFFKEFSELHPTICIDILEHPDQNVMQRLINNEIELGILGGTVHSSLFRSIPFSKHYPCAVINKKHPLAKKKYLCYQDLADQPVAMENRDFFSHQIIFNQFLNANVMLDVVIQTTEIDFLHKLVGTGECIGISFDIAALGNTPSNTVVRPFKDKNFIWQTYIVYKLNAQLTQQAQCFLDYALDWHQAHASKLLCWPKPYDEYNLIYK